MVSVGDKVPSAGPLTEGKPDNQISIPSSGKILIVGVPGAFTPPCSSQVPGYLEDADKFKSAGVDGIYIVGVNDIFCMNAWEEKLAGSKKNEIVHFVSDGTGKFTDAMGQLFDASGLLGNHRSKRYVAVVQDGKVSKLEVEDEAPSVTVTAADKILGGL